MPVTTQARVRYAETDQMGYVYYGNYYTYFEVGRVEYMRARGVAYKDMEIDDDSFIVVAESSCRYRRPARYDDLLAIEVWVTAIEKVRLNFGHRILNQNGKLILEAETFHVCTGVDEKPKRLPEELAGKLKPHLNAMVVADSKEKK